jgi:hypothetical protein
MCFGVKAKEKKIIMKNWIAKIQIKKMCPSTTEGLENKSSLN